VNGGTQFLYGMFWCATKKTTVDQEAGIFGDRAADLAARSFSIPVHVHKWRPAPPEARPMLAQSWSRLPLFRIHQHPEHPRRVRVMDDLDEPDEPGHPDRREGVQSEDKVGHGEGKPLLEREH